MWVETFHHSSQQVSLPPTLTPLHPRQSDCVSKGFGNTSYIFYTSLWYNPSRFTFETSNRTWFIAKIILIYHRKIHAFLQRYVIHNSSRTKERTRNSLDISTDAVGNAESRPAVDQIWIREEWAQVGVLLLTDFCWVGEGNGQWRCEGEGAELHSGNCD